MSEKYVGTLYINQEIRQFKFFLLSFFLKFFNCQSESLFKQKKINFIRMLFPNRKYTPLGDNKLKPNNYLFHVNLSLSLYFS